MGCQSVACARALQAAAHARLEEARSGAQQHGSCVQAHGALPPSCATPPATQPLGRTHRGHACSPDGGTHRRRWAPEATQPHVPRRAPRDRARTHLRPPLDACAAAGGAAPRREEGRGENEGCPRPPPPRRRHPAPQGGAPRSVCSTALPCSRSARLQEVQNPTVTACAAAPRSLQTLARAGSLRAASGRFLKTLGQKNSS